MEERAALLEACGWEGFSLDFAMMLLVLLLFSTTCPLSSRQMVDVLMFDVSDFSGENKKRPMP